MISGINIPDILPILSFAQALAGFIFAFMLVLASAVLAKSLRQFSRTPPGPQLRHLHKKSELTSLPMAYQLLRRR